MQNPGFFSNAQNLQINGGHFSNSSSRVEVARVGSDNGLDLLRQKSALEAVLDSKERFDPPKCDPDTRLAIIKQVRDWILEDDSSASMMWLYGPAGSGKSALAQSIAELCQKEGQLAASFFFSRTAANRSDGRMLIPTIAYQLAQYMPIATTSIKKSVERDPSILERSNETQTEKLLIEPLNSWLTLVLWWIAGSSPFQWTFDIQPHPRLIVIDGLDECHDPEIQTDLIKVVAGAILRFRLPFRLVITSRPESHIVRAFEQTPIFKSVHISKINLGDDLNTEHDISVFLQKEFDKIKLGHPLRRVIPTSWPSVEQITELVRRSSGQFIYPSTIIKYIQSPKHRPTDRLLVILGLSLPPATDTPFAQLDALYTYIFSCVKDKQSVLRIFGLLFVAREGDDSRKELTTPRRIEELLSFCPGEVELLLDDLLSIISLDGPDEPIKVLHASLADYLLTSSRSGAFYIDTCLMHELMARRYLRLVSGMSSRHLFGLRKSYVTPMIAHCEQAFLSDPLRHDLEEFDFVLVYKALAFQPEFESDEPYALSFLTKFCGVLLRKEFKEGQQTFNSNLARLDRLLTARIRKVKKHPTEACRSVAQNRANAFMALRHTFPSEQDVPSNFERLYHNALVEANIHILQRCKDMMTSATKDKADRKEKTDVSHGVQDLSERESWVVIT